MKDITSCLLCLKGNEYCKKGEMYAIVEITENNFHVVVEDGSLMLINRSNLDYKHVAAIESIAYNPTKFM